MSTQSFCIKNTIRYTRSNGEPTIEGYKNLESFSHYKVNIVKFDDDHLIILTLIQDIVKYKNSNIKTLLDKMLHLENVISEHMNAEEKFMSDIKYPYITSHISDHNEIKLGFCLMIEHLKHCMDNHTLLPKGINCDIEKKIDKLENMFLQHIDIHDTQYGNYYKNLQKDIES